MYCPVGCIRRGFGGFWRHIVGIAGAPWVSRGQFGGVRLEFSVGVPHLGRSWGPFEAILGRRGPLQGRFGVVLAGFGGS